MDIINKNLLCVKGVGENRLKLFDKLGISSVDLLFGYYPKKYIDFRICRSVNDLSVVGSVLYRLKIIKKHPTQILYRGRTVTKIEAIEDDTSVFITYFNNKYFPDSLEVDNEYLFYGKITRSFISNEMTNPWIVKEDETKRLIPIYGTTEGLTSKLIEKTVSSALRDYKEYIEETLPTWILSKHALISRREAIKKIHEPKDFDDVETARKRLIFEEILVMLLGMQLFKERSKKHTSLFIKDNVSVSFIKSLPFTLTQAQKRCINEILTDLTGSSPMNRLLQGDVGSGKTIIAAAATAVVASAGFQVAVMVPTEILAQQHFETFNRYLTPLNISIGLLTGTQKGKNREKLLDGIFCGSTKVIIGTHALIGRDVTYRNLGLVITDEQHRFGVEQRDSLARKGINPHLLVMSATPIPRTLAMIIYGDLDISEVDELPVGRIPTKTFLVDGSYRNRYLDFVKQQVDIKHQAFIVCPLIETEDETDERLAATEYKVQLEEEYMKGYSIGLIHGRMRAAEKEAVMKQFINGTIQILVSTTVIEVGLDVPNANILVIENAEYFGLSTLHQLRGRIGRGYSESYCILVSDSNDENTLSRLRILKNTYSGFDIAKHDLEMRGPGELLGNRQHGLPEMKIADLVEDQTLLIYAQNAAKSIMGKDRSLITYPHLKREVDRMFEIEDYPTDGDNNDW